MVSIYVTFDNRVCKNSTNHVPMQFYSRDFNLALMRRNPLFLWEELWTLLHSLNYNYQTIIIDSTIHSCIPRKLFELPTGSIFDFCV